MFLSFLGHYTTLFSFFQPFPLFNYIIKSDSLRRFFCGSRLCLLQTALFSVLLRGISCASFQNPVLPALHRAFRKQKRAVWPKPRVPKSFSTHCRLFGLPACRRPFDRCRTPAACANPSSRKPRLFSLTASFSKLHRLHAGELPCRSPACRAVNPPSSRLPRPIRSSRARIRPARR